MKQKSVLGIRIRLLEMLDLFSHKGVQRTEIILSKYPKILAKNLIFKTEDNVPAGKLNINKIFYLHS
jgi:hypothetical protein